MQIRSNVQQNSGSGKGSLRNQEVTGLFRKVFEMEEVKISEVLRGAKCQKDLGSFYRMEKTFFYKQKILAFYLLHFLYCQIRVPSSKTKEQCKAILALFFASIKEFENSIQTEYESKCLEPNYLQQLIGVQKSKQKLILMLKQTIETQRFGEAVFGYEQLQGFLDVLVGGWTKKGRSEGCWEKDVERVFGQKFTIENFWREQKITQIIVRKKNQRQKQKQKGQQQKHLLYKNILFKIGDSTIAEIIQTNQQKYVYFTIELPKGDPTIKKTKKSRISELFQQKSRRQVLQSEGEKSESDGRSEIVKDDEFYRISSKISTSMRRNSFNQGENAGEQEFLNKNCLCDSINAGWVLEHNKLGNNQVSQIYTRSSSLERSSFPYRDNLSTSIDLLMRLEMEGEARRKKSCENVRTCERSVERGDSQGRNVASRLRINLLSEDRKNLYERSFQPVDSGAKNRQGTAGFDSSRRLSNVRSFFRQNQQLQNQ